MDLWHGGTRPDSRSDQRRPELRLLRGVLIPILAVALVIVVPAIGLAGVHNVTNGNDAGPGSYRQAIIDANADGDPVTVDFAAGLTVTLSSGDVVYSNTQPITLNGNGSTIDGSGAHQILDAPSAPSITVNDLTMRNGETTGSGGAIEAPSADITIKDTTLAGNTAVSSGGAVRTSSGSYTATGSTFTGNTAGTDGGALQTTSGSSFITGSTFTGNTAGNDGGALHTSTGSYTVTGSTFTGNTAGDDGGALRTNTGSYAVTNATFTGNGAGMDGGSIYTVEGAVSLNNVTLTGNQATGGLGGALMVEDTGGSAQFSNSILSGPGGQCGGLGAFTSGGYNIGSDATCNLSGTGDKANTDPMLGSLADNDGPTMTHALLAASPAVDAGNPATPGSGGAACEATDQRGLARNCDIGAYELVLCATVPVNRIGTPGNDTLTGTDGPDGFLAGEGNDTATGLGADDAFCLEGGNDSSSGGPGNDVILGGPGNDTLDGGDGDDQIEGSDGDDVATGSAGNEQILGGTGNDTGDAGEGDDTFLGGDGNDVGKGGAGKDLLKGEKGNDRLNGGQGKDRLLGGSGTDRLICGAGKKEVGKGGPGRDKARKCEKGKA